MNCTAFWSSQTHRGCVVIYVTGFTSLTKFASIYAIFIHWGNCFSLNYILPHEIPIIDYGILQKDEKLPSDSGKIFPARLTQWRAPNWVCCGKSGRRRLLACAGAKPGPALRQLSRSVPPSCTQGGFDIAERMFYSVKKEWESSSRDNMGDVRELIPEFFYLPDFLLNSNHIQLGQTHNSPSVHVSEWLEVWISCSRDWHVGAVLCYCVDWKDQSELIHMGGYIGLSCFCDLKKQTNIWAYCSCCLIKNIIHKR